jgi:thiosulfate/3-mercaptopyruvate sulfurtransferase
MKTCQRYCQLGVVGLLSLYVLWPWIPSAKAGPSPQEGPTTAAGDNIVYARPELLLEPTDLAKPQPAPRWVILDARPREEYNSAHIPGALHVDHDAWKKAFAEGRDADSWSERIGRLGITRESKVVVYDAIDTKDAARIWWILRFWGVDHVSLLNGGWQGWQQADLPVTSSSPVPGSATAFRATPGWNRLATTKQVLDWLPQHEMQIVDARSYDEHCGVNKRDNKRGGAIPGAKHLEWSELIDPATHRFHSPRRLRQLFDQAEIDLTRPTASHCNGGGRAAVMAFGLELMGVDQVRNYYRGWGEWGNLETTPVEVPQDQK